MLLGNTFSLIFCSIYYFYQHNQPKFSTTERKKDIFSLNFLNLNLFLRWKTLCLCLTIRVKKFLMTKIFQNFQLPDARETLVWFVLSLFYFNSV